MFKRRNASIEPISQVISPIPVINEKENFERIINSEFNRSEHNSLVLTEQERALYRISMEERDRLKMTLLDKKTTLEHYRFIKLIGKGSFGKVLLALHKLTQAEVAIKVFDKSLILKDEYRKKRVSQEIYILKKLGNHSKITRMLEVFETSTHLLMVMEYLPGGDLLTKVRYKGAIGETEAKGVFKQVVIGLAHIHCRSVAHRDIKLDNILLTKEGKIKICDFGVSRISKKGELVADQCGTPAYLAPEIV
jgi:serine/threonine protein kinase